MHWFKNLIEKLTLIFKFSKINSPSVKLTNKTNIENKAGKVGIQIGQVNIRQGLTYAEVKDLIVHLLDQKIISFRDEAEVIYEERAIEFEKPLIEKIKSRTYESFKLPIEDIIILKIAFAKLKKLQRKVIYYIFEKDLTQTEVAKKLGLSQRQVARIKESALKDLKDLIENIEKD